MKKIEEYLYNNGLDWTDIILYILMGVLIALAVACIVYGIWRSFTARHEYISGIVCCTDKYKDKTDTYLPMKIGDFTNLINIDDTDYISIFQYGNKEIKAENKDIYDQVKVDKQYNVKIEITTYKDGTKDYDVMKIISEIKE